MRDESAAQPMGLLDLVGLNFRSSEGASDTLDDNGEEERRKTLEALTDEDFLNDSSDGRAGSPHAGNVSYLLHCFGLGLAVFFFFHSLTFWISYQG